MAATDSATGVNNSVVTVGQNLTDTVTASSTATATAVTVEGIATGNAVSTTDVGVLDSTLNVGGNGTLTVNETGVATGSATTVNAVNSAAAAAGDPTYALIPAAGSTPAYGQYTTVALNTLANGDRIVVGSTGANPGTYYVTNLSGSAIGSTYQLSTSPGGAGITTDVSADLDIGDTQTQVTASSAYAGFTGNTGGIIDSSATGGSVTNDVVIGAAATVGVTVDNTATATSVNTDGGAAATSFIKESYGLFDVGVQAGSSGSLIANVDANAVAAATTVGGTTVLTGADATSAATITDAVGINASVAGVLGNITFGDGATISATAGTSADKLQVSSTSTSTTGNATAVSTLGDAVGINTVQDNTQDATSDLISVGNDGAITGLGFAAVSAAATTTNGDSVATAVTTDTSGIEAGTITIGDGGTIQAQAGIGSTVTAAVTGSTLASDFTATATNTVTDTAGLDLEKLTVGGNALQAGGYGVLGRTDADLTTTASTIGAGTNADDKASATGTLTNAVGIDIGDGALAEDGLTVGNNASIAGIADTTNAVTATSTAGEVDAISVSTTV